MVQLSAEGLALEFQSVFSFFHKLLVPFSAHHTPASPFPYLQAGGSSVSLLPLLQYLFLLYCQFGMQSFCLINSVFVNLRQPDLTLQYFNKKVMVFEAWYCLKFWQFFILTIPLLVPLFNINYGAFFISYTVHILCS